MFVIVSWSCTNLYVLSDMLNKIYNEFGDIYVFLISASGDHMFSHGALMNIGIQMAGASAEDEVIFFSCTYGNVHVSNKMNVGTFIRLNGFDNDEEYANSAHLYEVNRDGLQQIFAEDVKSTRIDKKLFYYVVKPERDVILPLDFMSQHNISIQLDNSLIEIY